MDTLVGAEPGAAHSSIHACVLLPPPGRALCSPGCVSLLQVLKHRGEGRCHGVMHSSDPALP